MVRPKTCGCLIATSVVQLEIAKKKTALKVEEINKKLRSSKDKKTIKGLNEEKKMLLNSMKAIGTNREGMKKRFDTYIKRSGYVPPKFKHKG